MLSCEPIDINDSGFLNYPIESKSIEYKTSFAWPEKKDFLPDNQKAQEVIRTILALSNTRDGGKIIIGVDQDREHKKLTPAGVSEEILKTYDHDSIFEMVRYFGNPQPEFETKCHKWKDMKFIIFHVEGFKQGPVISKTNIKKNIEQIKSSAIYIRTHKPETKVLDKPEELYNLMKLTTEKNARWVQDLCVSKNNKTASKGFKDKKSQKKTAVRTNEQKLFGQKKSRQPCSTSLLSDLNEDSEILVNTIKSKGYWMVSVYPISNHKKLIPSNKLVDIVDNAQVSLRGWYYPHITRKESMPYKIVEGIEHRTNSGEYKEFWRMNTNGNFSIIKSLKEDWMSDDVIQSYILAKDIKLDGKWLGIVNALYSITEFFEFARRLSMLEFYVAGIVVCIELYDIYKRYLVADSYKKMPFYPTKKYVCQEQRPFRFSYTFENNATDDFRNKAFDAFLELLDLFNWKNIPVENLRDDQVQFLEGKS